MTAAAQDIRLVIMGPSGSGKTAIGTHIARALDLRFVDADDLHSADSIAKMAAGQPLSDSDRLPWLDRVGQTLRDEPRVIVACSALARRYRDILRSWAPDVQCIELLVRPDELRRRMNSRSHYMPPSLLDSQLELLEPLSPGEAGIRVENHQPVAAVVRTVVNELGFHEAADDYR